MRQKIYIRPTKSGLVIGLIAAIAMLAFGIIFFVVLSIEEAPIGQAFMAFWILIVLIICGYYIYSLVNYEDKPDSALGEQIDIPDDLNTREIRTSFDDKLRKLNKLREEKLISEEEFATKRQEIMQQKW